MPETSSAKVEMTCLQGLADLERIEGPWVKTIAAGEPEGTAVILRLLLAHMASTSKRQLGAMVLDRLDIEEGATAFKAAGHQRLQGAAEA